MFTPPNRINTFSTEESRVAFRCIDSFNCLFIRIFSRFSVSGLASVGAVDGGASGNK
jgi:hypothetical protein